MKKIGGYIMLLLILANIFAPLYADNSYVGVKKAEAAVFSSSDSEIAKKAQDECLGTSKKEFCFSSRYVAVGAKITLTTYVIGVDHTGLDLYSQQVVIKDATTGETVKTLKEVNYKTGSDGKLILDSNNNPTIDPTSPHDILQENVSQGDFKNKVSGDTDNYDAVLFYTGEIDGLQENRLYNFGITVSKYNVKEYIVTSTDKKYPDISQTLQVQTGLPKNGKPAVNSGTADATSGTSGDIMPACSIIGTVTLGIVNGDGTFMGCIAQALYYVIFIPTSYIFALAGKFFDFTFKYSISDTSYRATFVIEGWKIIRDLCNIFFIFVLLMAAIKMILDVGHGAKDAIIKVVVIGLLINFSLFTTQIIIDSSNILARLFYNSDAIKITMMKNGAGAENFSQAGVNMYSDSISSTGEIPISAAIVDKVNPQSIILNAKQINVTDPAALNNPNGVAANDGIGVGPFILITLLASAVNLIGFFIFLSIGLMFVARVIGLWFAMILVPLAFFSYTMPHMLDDMDYVGWKKWWPETLKLAFMAPVFMFFMYLILIFLDNSFLDLSHVTSQTGINFVLSIILPFAFIIILLNQAKSVAKTMSGKIGGMITNYTTAAGGMILGGAALGTAMIGRQTMGAVSKYAMNDGARQNAMSFKGVKDARAELTGLNKLNPFAYAKVGYKAVTGLGQAAAAGLGHSVAQIGKKTDATGKTTNWMQRKSKDVANKKHADHVLEEYTQSTYHDKDKTWGTLIESEQKLVKDNINKDLLAKEFANKKYEKLTTSEKATVDTYMRDKGNDWGAAAKAKADEVHHDPTDGRHLHTGDVFESDSKLPVAMSEFVNALRKGSYDMRNLSSIETKSKAFVPSLMVGATSGVASMMRNGLKDTVGINHGKGNKDFMKDMKEVLTEAFKTAKLEVKLPESHGGGHGGGHDDHGGGHDDHGGGHH